MMPPKPVIHIVDDEEPIRDSLELLLQGAGLLTRAWASPLAVLQAAEALEPGCFIIDIRMPEMDGLSLLEELRRRQINLPVIIMTGHGDIPLAVRAMRAGAVDFVEKPFAKALMLAAIELALAAQPAEQRPAAASTKAPPEDPRLARLSVREREVLMELLAGSGNKLIAHTLGISPRTVEIHRARVMDKMGARSLPELVRLALAVGLKPKAD